MREFQVSRYIKKWLPWIIVVCVAFTVAIYGFLSMNQTYVASAVIHYNNESAEQGYTPMGTKLDVNEIKSSGIISKVMINLGLSDGAYSVDDLVSRVTITEVIDEDEKERKDALLEDGEEYLYEPVTYIVSFDATNSEGEGFARMVLDEILDAYFSLYSEKYVNSGSMANSLSEIYDGNYDYIEMMEIIEENIANTLSTLYSYGAAAPYYRASSTGMSFNDLANEFTYIQAVEISELYAEIFENQITKDKNLLVSRYNERIKNYEISNLAEEEKIQDLVVLMDEYVTKMRDSGNTDIMYEYILDEVYEKELVNIFGDLLGDGEQTVTYDKLIYSWRDHNESKEYAIIDSAYCSYVIKVFTGAGAQKTAQYSQLVANVEEEIKELVIALEELYALVDETNVEYNEYVGAENISMLSTVSLDEAVNVKLYTVIAAIFLLIVCCLGAILLGRMNDIINYAFFTDHMTDLNNRASFDNYLKRNDKKLLDNGVVCVMISISNQSAVNLQFGREVGNQLIKFFADSLKDVFQKTDAFLVYNGNAQFFAVINRTDAVACEYILERFALTIDKRQSLQEVPIQYDMGLAETQRDDVHRIRGLLSKSISLQKRYVSEAVGDKAEA